MTGIWIFSVALIISVIWLPQLQSPCTAGETNGDYGGILIFFDTDNINYMAHTHLLGSPNYKMLNLFIMLNMQM